jgi:exonuclease V gamma subunit
LVVLFQGRDARDDALLNPSPVVLELLQYLRARLGVPADQPMRRRAPAQAEAAVIIEHALHPFAPRNFAAGASHAVEWLAAATALCAPVTRRDRLAGPLVPQPGTRATGDAGRPDVVAPDANPLDARPADARPANARPTDSRPTDAPLLEGTGVGVLASPNGQARAPDLRLPELITLDWLRAALSDPIAFWLRQRLGIALPPTERPIEGPEPMWPDESLDRGLLDRSARELLAGKPLAGLEAALRAAPATAGGAVGQRQARGVLERAQGLVARAGGLEPADRLVDISLPLGGRHTLRARLPLPAADGRQRIVSGYALNLHGLIEAWLRHALMAAWLEPVAGSLGGSAAQLVETVLVAPDALATVRIEDPRAALCHALDAALGILAKPPVAFPRAWLAAWRESRQQGPLAELLRTGDRRGAAARSKLVSVIEGGNWSAGEIARPWQAVFWRDAGPDPDLALSDGDALWAPILADIAIDPERGR